MKVNTTLRRAKVPRNFSNCAGRRWKSQDKASLTEQALAERVQQGLGDNIKFDVASKTVKTKHGSLPVSPVLDPSWAKTHQRATKPGIDTTQELTRFRRRFLNNPYAMALSTPMRICAVTRTSLPRYFLQDWEIIKHHETQRNWIAPGPASFRYVQRTMRPSNDADGEAVEQHGAPDSTGEPTAAAEGPQADAVHTSPRRGAAPVTVYTLSSASLHDKITEERLSPKILAGRSGMAVPDSMRGATWRPDMGSVVLRMMRHSVVDALVTRSTRQQGPSDKFIKPCATWDELEQVHRKMAVLWLPRDDAMNTSARSRYATHDREGSRFHRKVAVHNLHWLLGDEEVKRLREESDMFRKHDLFMLQSWPSKSMHSLHLLLWKLQGYLDTDGGSDGIFDPALTELARGGE